MKIKNYTRYPTKAIAAAFKWTREMCDTGVKPLRTVSKITVRYENNTDDFCLVDIDAHHRRVIEIFLPKKEDHHTHSPWYQAVLRFGVAMAEMDNGPPVPTGALGIFRQKVGAIFLSHPQTYIAVFHANVPPPDPHKRMKERHKKLAKSVKQWTKKSRLAKTKLDYYTTRLRRVTKQLEEAQKQTPAP